MGNRKYVVVAGSGSYPRLIVEGAKKADAGQIDVVAIKGSTWRSTCKAADNVEWISLGSISQGLRNIAAKNYDGLILAGQVNPLSLFRGRFDSEVKKWLDELKVKTAHTIFGKLIEKMSLLGIKTLPASCFMDGNMPGEGLLTAREPTKDEYSDIHHAAQVAKDVGNHDVGQTVMVKRGMVLAVEAFEGTNAAIKRGGKLGGPGSIVFKAARVGHDMRFDIPVVGLKTIKTMKKAGATALAFQAGRLVLLDKEKVLAYADKHSISIIGIESGLDHAPLRP